AHVAGPRVARTLARLAAFGGLAPLPAARGRSRARDELHPAPHRENPHAAHRAGRQLLEPPGAPLEAERLPSAPDGAAPLRTRPAGRRPLPGDGRGAQAPLERG